MTRLRVLVADDDADLLATVETALVRGAGADVVCATTGTEVIDALAEQGPFDLLITDVSMPWMSGLQAAHAAREVGLDIPMIIMTGLPESLIREQFGALGKEAVLLAKPFSGDELRAAISSLVPAAWPKKIAV